MTETQIQNYQEILHGKKSLRQTMEIFGFSETEIIESIGELKKTDIHDCTSGFITQLTFAHQAYILLVKEGVISDKEVYRFTDQEPSLGDISFKGPHSFRFMHDGWKQIGS